MLSGFFVVPVASIREAYAHLQDLPRDKPSLDFIILDDQSEAHAEDLSRRLQTMNNGSLRDTQIVHLYTPTADTLNGLAKFNSSIPNVTKMTKPPRQARLLHLLSDLKNLPSVPSHTTASDVGAALKDISSARRTLFGNVLIAEGKFRLCI
jgi:hypothetical protein